MFNCPPGVFAFWTATLVISAGRGMRIAAAFVAKDFEADLSVFRWQFDEGVHSFPAIPFSLDAVRRRFSDSTRLRLVQGVPR